MSTAILYSGQARTFASCFPNQAWYVLRHFKDPHFFVSISDDAQAGSMELLKTRFSNVQIEYVKQPDFPKAEEMARTHAHGGYGISAHPQNILRAFWHYQKVWKMLPEHTFDCYVRIRPDLWFQDFEPTGCLSPFPGVCFTPPWGSYGGINDRFAIMGDQACKRYMNAIDRIDALLAAGCPFHPETLTRAAVEEDGKALVNQTLLGEFRIRRLGDPKSYDINLRDEHLVPEPVIGYELMRASL